MNNEAANNGAAVSGALNAATQNQTDRCQARHGSSSNMQALPCGKRARPKMKQQQWQNNLAALALLGIERKTSATVFSQMSNGSTRILRRCSACQQVRRAIFWSATGTVDVQGENRSANAMADWLYRKSKGEAAEAHRDRREFGTVR